MGLLSPWFLLGALAVGLPLWLHLLRQHRRNPQEFSSLMFFERRLQSSVRHRRLRYLVLLSLRIALLTLLAIAFASPFINRKTTATQGKVLTVIAVDRSFSMRYGDRMEQAKLRAKEELRGIKKNRLAEVLAVDSRVEGLTTPTLDRTQLAAAIDAIQPTDRASSFGQLVRALRVQEQATGMGLDVRFVSDMQQTGMPRSFRDLQVGPRTALRPICVGTAQAANWAVEAVNTAFQVHSARNTRVTATITGWQTAATTKSVSLVLDGKTVASRNIAVPGNGRAQAEFVGFDVPYGDHRAEVRIAPHDGLSQDDTFPFPLERSDPRKILFLSDSGRVRDALYYRAAMDSAANTGLVVQPTTLGDLSDFDLARCAFVVLSDMETLPPATEQRFVRYVRDGGSLLIALGQRSPEEGTVPVTGDTFTMQRQTQGATFVDDQSPALRGISQFADVQFFETAHLEPKPDARILMKLADGSPLLLEEHIGDGRVLTFASGLANVTNDFPLHTLFLPFVAQTGRYLAGEGEGAEVLVTGNQIQLRSAANRGSAAVNITGPDGKNELSLSEAAKAVSFEVDRDGFYEVQRAHGPRTLVAVHTDRRESDLTLIPRQTLALWSNLGSHQPLPQEGATTSMVQPWSLWQYALVLALAVALAESILANHYLGKGKQAL